MGYIGFELGLSGELAKLTGVVAGFLLSFRYYQAVGDFLAKRTPLSIECASALAMVSLVSVIYLLVAWALRLLEKVAKINFHPKVDQIGGLIAGLTRAVFVASVILGACRQLPSAAMTSSIEEHSMSGHALLQVAPAVYDATSPVWARMTGGGRGAER